MANKHGLSQYQQKMHLWAGKKQFALDGWKFLIYYAS
jgi:hypothetical protein